MVQEEQIYPISVSTFGTRRCGVVHYKSMRTISLYIEFCNLQRSGES